MARRRFPSLGWNLARHRKRQIQFSVRPAVGGGGVRGGVDVAAGLGLLWGARGLFKLSTEPPILSNLFFGLILSDEGGNNFALSRWVLPVQLSA